MSKKKKEQAVLDDGNEAHLASQAAMDDIQVQQIEVSEKKSPEPLMPKLESSKIVIPETPRVVVQTSHVKKPDQKLLIKSIINKSLTAQKKVEKTFNEAQALFKAKSPVATTVKKVVAPKKAAAPKKKALAQSSAKLGAVDQRIANLLQEVNSDIIKDK